VIYILSTTPNGNPHLLCEGFMKMILRPWRACSILITIRKTRMSLCALDDRMLKDIGISRGEIEEVSQPTSASARRFMDCE
jgi:uncharacterized protein YjiS (DUF1127 family)